MRYHPNQTDEKAPPGMFKEVRSCNNNSSRNISNVSIVKGSRVPSRCQSRHRARRIRQDIRQVKARNGRFGIDSRDES